MRMRIFPWTRIVSLAALTAVWLGISLSGDVVFAQDAGAPRCPKSASGDLWSQVDWLRLEISGGRITLTSRRCGQTRVSAEPSEDSPRRQALTVDAQPGAILATFETADDRETVTLTCDARQQVIDRAQPQAAGAPAAALFPAGRRSGASLAIGADESRKYAAASLWHLLVAEPTARDQLLPC